ncbi:TetR/AcrR family transcriptional regulator [Candidatus Colwellia aromaticivorans]|uniref:TetR/AcrR family transcriptional regulator n=1 Tax=Candidatus Colwellia aromaticivorans TaxID=2267621 RepID=UPI000DF22619|nr:TetR/AcrR family transcriptional regulator [Candidatus Colwellia aromaticivorans]
MVNKRSKNEIKRQQILDAAVTLFTEHGYAATSMDLIAKNADVSKQTVYSHFGSKDELFSASVEYKCESLNILDLSLHDLSDPQAVLLKLAQNFTEFITSKEACAVHKICVFESTSYPQVSEIFYKAGPLRIINEVTLLMAKLHQQKILVIENPRHAASQFLNMMKGELWMQTEFNIKERISPEEVEEYLRNSVAFFIRGYAIK